MAVGGGVRGFAGDRGDVVGDMGSIPVHRGDVIKHGNECDVCIE